MQCLDTTGSWNPVTEGKLAVLDTNTNSISEIITLTDCFNPVDASEGPSGNYLYFSCVNNYEGGNDGSIIKMNYANHSIQKIADESLFGGDIGGITIKLETEMCYHKQVCLRQGWTLQVAGRYILWVRSAQQIRAARGQ